MSSFDVKVSVIIPTCNRIDTLKRAISSVIGQTYKNIEIVLVDDNLKDSQVSKEVFRICEECAARCNLIYHKTDGYIGGGRARNEGCGIATGEYFAFLDDDDIFLPEKVEMQLDFVIRNSLDMSFHDVIWKNESGRIVEIRRFNYIYDFSSKNLLKEHLLHNIAPTSIYFISADAFRKTKGFGDLKVGQDIYLMFDCIKQDFKIGYLQGAYVVQYLHSGDRLSKGKSKISGENWWYKEKRKYIGVLDKKELRFFRFRHYIILFFACLRSKYIIRMLGYGIIAFCISPKDSVVEGKRYLIDKIKYNKREYSIKDERV